MSRFIVLLLLAALLGVFRAAAQPEPGYRVLTLDLEGAVSPAQADLLRSALRKVEAEDMDMLALRLDTPGGLNFAMRDMVRDMLASPVPVLVWVGPSGALAGSAGVFLVAASDVAGMSPNSTIGSAHPISASGEELSGTLREKSVNDMLSLVRGLAGNRGRNVEWYQDAVRKNANLTATEAVDLGVVEILAPSMQEFVRESLKRGITKNGIPLQADAPQVELVSLEPGLRHVVLSWLLDPTVAYLLLLGGIAGLFFEMTTPGVVLPGVLGGVSLVLGLYALALLPTNIAGVLLILLGILFFVLEIFIASFGLLTLAGATALFIGSTILFEPGSTGPLLPREIILAAVLTVVVVVGIALFLVARAQRQKPSMGMQTLIGLTGEVLSWSDRKGQIRVRGEIWSASSSQTLSPGDKVLVLDHAGLTLTVAKKDA